MTKSSEREFSLTPWLWAAWGLGLAVLTYGLVSPEPQKLNEVLLPSEMQFWASKGVHVAGYGFFAASACWLCAGARTRLLFCLLLVLHGAATEYVQTLVPGRFGSQQDVGIDAAGVLLGWLAARFARRGVNPPAPG